MSRSFFSKFAAGRPANAANAATDDEDEKEYDEDSKRMTRGSGRGATKGTGSSQRHRPHVRAVPYDSGGWIRAKKRGRDDDEIERDRERVFKAEAEAKAKARKRGRGVMVDKTQTGKKTKEKKKKKTTTTTTTSRGKATLARRRATSRTTRTTKTTRTTRAAVNDDNDEDDSGDSEGEASWRSDDEDEDDEGYSTDDFIAEDDGDDDEEEEASVTDDDDDDDDEGTFMIKAPKRTSRPPPALQKLASSYSKGGTNTNTNTNIDIGRKKTGKKALTTTSKTRGAQRQQQQQQQQHDGTGAAAERARSPAAAKRRTRLEAQQTRASTVVESDGGNVSDSAGSGDDIPSPAFYRIGDEKDTMRKPTTTTTTTSTRTTRNGLKGRGIRKRGENGEGKRRGRKGGVAAALSFLDEDEEDYHDDDYHDDDDDNDEEKKSDSMDRGKRGGNKRGVSQLRVGGMEEDLDDGKDKDVTHPPTKSPYFSDKQKNTTLVSIAAATTKTRATGLQIQESDDDDDSDEESWLKHDSQDTTRSGASSDASYRISQTQNPVDYEEDDWEFRRALSNADSNANAKKKNASSSSSSSLLSKLLMLDGNNGRGGRDCKRPRRALRIDDDDNENDDEKNLDICDNGAYGKFRKFRSPVGTSATAGSKAGRRFVIDEDDFMDDDEATALALALKESEEMSLTKGGRGEEKGGGWKRLGKAKDRRNRKNDVDDDDDDGIGPKKRRGGAKTKMSTKTKARSMAPEVKAERKGREEKEKEKNNKKKKVLIPLSASDDEDDEPEADESFLAESSDGGDGNDSNANSDEGDAEEEEEEEEDEYVEEAEREAGSVLAAANSLSAEVLRNMAGWCSGGGGKGDGGEARHENTIIPRGMIVDGALAMSTLGKDGGRGGGGGGGKDGDGSNRPSWITNETMRRICPELNLADYQLVGVNWLALLHGMRCDVGGSGIGNSKDKGSNGGRNGATTNVNGVLADEMGLGKTVQTIAFLAWLRYGRESDRGTGDSCLLGRAENKQHREVVRLDGVIDDSDDDDDENLDESQDVIEVDESIELLPGRRDKRRAGANEDVVCLDEDDDDVRGRGRSSGGSGGGRTRPHIVIVPASVLSNWEREFRTFCPAMKVVKYHGTMAEREMIRESLRNCLPPERGGRGKAAARRGREGQGREPLDVVLTTFSYFQKEKSDDRSFLRKFKFDYMVVDEAHCLKNPRGKLYRNMDRFVTDHRLLLTGTPVQNSPKELMSLLCFLMPLFSRKGGGGGGGCDEDDFDEDGGRNDGGEHMLDYFVTLERTKGSGGGGGGEGKRARGGGVVGGKTKTTTEENPGEEGYRKLKQLFAPFVLRRKKAEVLSQIMPPKTRRVEFVPFDDATRIVYDGIISSHLKARDQATNGSGDSATARKHLFTSLRKAANHPLLLRRRHADAASSEHLSRMLFRYGYFGRDGTCTQDRVKEELETFSDYDVHCAALDVIDEDPTRATEMGRYTLTQDDLFCSPKFVRLRELLPELVKEGHRMLIFSQWTRCLDLLGCLMESVEYKFLRLDGQTPIEARQKLIDKFNNDTSIPVFLLSTRAGGMGINLTAADTCILHDLDFNPFNDIQAEDRCHRIGQKKPVTIIKMVTEGTVDADIYAMQERKAKMNAAILESGGNSNNDGSSSRVDGGNKKKAMANPKPPSKKEETEEINNMLQRTMDRFLSSPSAKGGGIEV